MYTSFPNSHFKAVCTLENGSCGPIEKIQIATLWSKN